MSYMAEKVLIVGGGIAGLGSAIALAQADAEVRILERAPAFTEVGAGVQLGPNVTRILKSWDVLPTIEKVASYPANLQARSAKSGEVLTTLPLADLTMRYGSPYITIHRADLQLVLLEKVEALGVDVQCNSPVHQLPADSQKTADALVIADGVWSDLR